MHQDIPRPLMPPQGPASRSCIQCGSLFPSREPSHRVCQGCQLRFTRLRLLTRFDPRFALPSRGRWVEGRSASG
jgi:hypothetical protein